MSTSTTKTLDRLLWTAQIVVALVFLFAGSMKFIMSPAQMQQGPVRLPLSFLYFIGVCEILGAVGLVLPGLLRIRTALTPLAAAGLTIIMAGAAMLSLQAMGISAAIVPLVVGALTGWIVYGRTQIAPLVESRSRTPGLTRPLQSAR